MTCVVNERAPWRGVHKLSSKFGCSRISWAITAAIFCTEHSVFQFFILEWVCIACWELSWCMTPCHTVDNVWRVTVVWRRRGKIIRTVVCVLCTHTSSHYGWLDCCFRHRLGLIFVCFFASISLLGPVCVRVSFVCILCRHIDKVNVYLLLVYYVLVQSPARKTCLHSVCGTLNYACSLPLPLTALSH